MTSGSPPRKTQPRRIAAVLLPRLALECASEDAGAEMQRVVVVAEPTRVPKDATWVLRGIHRIRDATDDLRKQGVHPPQRVLDAQDFAPALDVVIVKERRLSEELQLLAELCLQVSPIVEPVLDGLGDRLLIDLTGLPRSVAESAAALESVCAEAGHQTLIAVSSGRLLSTALTRALQLHAGRRRQSGWTHVDDDRAAAVTRRLPLPSLGMSPELTDALLELGLNVAGDLMQLRQVRLAPRLQTEAQRVLDLLAMHDVAPLSGIAPPDDISEKTDLDFPLHEVEPLLFVTGPLTERICQRLRGRGERALAIDLILHQRPFEPGDPPTQETLSLAFPEPLDDAHAIMRALAVRLEVYVLRSEVHRVQLVSVRASRVPAGQQRMAFLAAEPGQEREVPPQLRALLAELTMELGEGRVGVLRSCSEVLPERMTERWWPASDVSPPDEGDPNDVVDRALGGRFLAAWPWPLHLLPTPVHVRGLRVLRRLPFCRLEGETSDRLPFVRDYQVLVTSDGRRALGIWDAENEELKVQGWFD